MDMSSVRSGLAKTVIRKANKSLKTTLIEKWKEESRGRNYFLQDLIRVTNKLGE